MAGGLMQLVAYGAQDVYLTGQPKVTFFQAVYKRHTNFAMENIIQTVNGSCANNNRVSVTIARNGDLIGEMYVSIPVPTTTLTTTSNNVSFDTNWLAERAIADVELTIGGQRIDKHFQLWWRLYSELFLNHDDKVSWAKMTTVSNISDRTTDSMEVQIPLLFFFNRNPGLYLPLIALQYHEVRLDFNLTPYYSSYFSTGAIKVWGNYVFLDTEERRRFAQKGHEYLIEQVQHTGADTISQSSQLVRLSYNHPVKELIWCYTSSNYNNATTALNSMWNFSSNVANVNVTSNLILLQMCGNYTQPHVCGGVPHIFGGQIAPGSNSAPVSAATGILFTGNNMWTEEGVPYAQGAPGLFNLCGSPGIEVGPLSKFKLILNGQDRFSEQPGKYFNAVQPFYYHTGNPYPGIYVYSFALQPEEHQPTGTCNFSRIDNAQVQVVLKTAVGTTSQQRMFAVNYNVLRIQSGMGGLAFSN
jgi:hypothetical protein